MSFVRRRRSRAIATDFAVRLLMIPPLRPRRSDAAADANVAIYADGLPSRSAICRVDMLILCSLDEVRDRFPAEPRIMNAAPQTCRRARAAFARARYGACDACRAVPWRSVSPRYAARCRLVSERDDV